MASTKQTEQHQLNDHPALIRAVEATIQAMGERLIVAAPLGIGKPNPLLNAFFNYAQANPKVQLNLFTALSLALPAAGTDLRGRFIRSFRQRHFGADYPELSYIKPQRNGELPDNINITEFYLQPGSMLGRPLAQRHYINSNYTHVARDMQSRGVNVICQMVSARQGSHGREFSLSCNPDVTLDLVERLEHWQQPCFRIAVVNPELPFMAHEAVVHEDFFDLVIDEPDLYFHPYAIPRGPVSQAEYAIGLHASTLIRDGGSLQIGIGSLGDALCHALILRHQEPPKYHSLIAALEFPQDQQLMRHWGGLEPFEKGLYAASEMFLDGFVHLYDAGILKRKVYDHVALQELINRDEVNPQQIQPQAITALYRAGLIHQPINEADLAWLQHWGFLKEDVKLVSGELSADDGSRYPADPELAHQWLPLLGQALRHGRVLHAAFFLGSRWFYQHLLQMSQDERDQFAMCRVSRINQLYEGEAMDRAQRLESRFLNTCMKMTLLGAAVSDGLANGQVVSGVGGQYNFVAMAHALHRGRSILMLRATREHQGKVESSIVWEYAHCTIPRHLRDLVITEYGIADLRGKTDEEVIQALICISDARFHQELMSAAKSHGKLDPKWQVPAWCQQNTPEHLAKRFKPYQEHFPQWPFGHDFTQLEFRVLGALQWLGKNKSNPGKLFAAWRNGSLPAETGESEPAWRQLLGWDGHKAPDKLKERALLRLVRGALRLS